MPPGDERTEAMNKAMVFRNAAENSRASLRQARRTGRMTAVRRCSLPVRRSRGDLIGIIVRAGVDHMGTRDACPR